MAEAALFNVADWVLKQLGSKILQEASLLWGIEDDVDKLTRTLSTIQALLLDADQKSSSNSSSSSQTHQLLLWLNELAEVVYDAQDLLDDFSTEMRRRKHRQTSGTERISKEVTDFFSSSNQIAYGLKIANGIREIKARIDEIAERGSVFNLLERHPVVDDSVGRKEREQTHSGVPHVVIGREMDQENIVELLLSSNCRDNFSAVPIVGIGGMGKTTLAQLVYNDERVKSHYEVAAWVCVSEDFDVKLIVEKIVESCTGEKPEGNLEMDSLRKHLHEIISGRKCLVVLDDVWNEDGEKWSRLKSLLMCGGKGSIVVMITTRLKKVARLATTRMEPYELKGLSESESWSLFREMAFEGGEATSVKHERIGREIVEKCKGVPLAVRTIAGALLFRETESEWAEFRSKEMWEMDQDQSDIMPTLKLSYDHLPTHLKHCFAYCRLFPKDYNMDVNTLIELWIAQGYVSSSNLSSQYNVGLEYFKDLLWRSFFQEVTRDKWGNIVYCKMHDLMHDLAVAVAGKQSVTLEVLSLPDMLSYDVNIRRIRHVSLDYRVRSLEEQCQVSSLVVNNADKLRTFLGVRKPFYWDSTTSDSIVFSNTTRLRVLDLSFLKMTVISQTIHKLKHLRYLDLSRNDMTTLPEEITGLLNLEVLMLEECRLLEKLPKGTGDLSNLAHLALFGCPALICLPLGIGRLSYLRELYEFLLMEGDRNCNTTAAAGIGELRYLNNLRGRLMIENLERVNNPSDGETANLKDKQYLEQLLLSWGTGRDIADVIAEGQLLEALRPHPNLKVLALSRNAGLKCPSWLPSLTNLVEIRLEESPNWKSLPPLDQLPFLAKLELSSLDSLEYIETGIRITPQPSSAASSTFFPSLKFLKLELCPKLKGWSTPSEELPQFPRVSEVIIHGCYDITSIPPFSLHLQHLTFIGGSKKVLNQILRIFPSSSPPSSSRLEYLDISDVTDLDILPDNLLPRLSSSMMKELGISDCPELRTLTPALPHHLTSLQKLYIYSCQELDLRELDGNVLLPRLSSVDFKGIPNLTSFPDWLQRALNLKEIETRDCPIQCIPEWMPELSELKLLDMTHWGRSVEECIAEDWPKIAHIATVILDGVCIKKDGCCQPLTEEENGWDTIEVMGFVIRQPWGPEEVGGGEGEGEETSKLVQLLRNCRSRLAAACNIFCRCFQA